MSVKPDLVALLGSRICHDLISPLGAIGNGLELLELTGTAPGPEVQLIRESVASANARIRLFRIAFGQAAAGQRISGSELSAVLKDYAAGTKTAFVCNLPFELPRSEARIGALLALCADAALPVGGQVTLDYRGEAWAARAEGRRLRDDLPWRLLTDAAAGDVAPAQIQFALLAEATQAKGRKCAALLGDGVVTIEA